MKLGGMRWRMNGWNEDEEEANSNVVSQHSRRHTEETTTNCWLRQCFSNYGPRTTSGPRGVSFWSFKKDRRKNKIQINFVSYYN
jgi:hypothetical protein